MGDLSVFDCDPFELAAQTLDAYPDPVVIEDFGPYRILERLGQGGMGEVFLAEDQLAHREVAIKFLPSVSPEPDMGRRFAEEMQTLSRLEHPFIARLYTAGVHPNGSPYFVMERVLGKPLDEYCRSKGLSLEERLMLMQLICEAVQYAHGRAVIHLDLKPSNVLVAEDGTPKLLDFGIAKHLEDNRQPVSETQAQVRCTPAYAAPEQISGGSVGTYTDVYALGLLLYELVAGKRASDFRTGEDGDKPSASPDRVNATQAAWEDLDLLLLKAIQKGAAGRYQFAGDLSRDIEHLLRGEPLTAGPGTKSYKLRKFAARNKRVLFATAAVVAIVTGLTIFYTVRLARARDAALREAARTKHIEQFMLGMFSGNDRDMTAPSQDLRVMTLLDRGVERLQSLKSEPDVQAAMFQTLGTLYQNLNELERSEALLKLALERRRSLFGPKSAETAESLVYLSLLRIDQAQFAEAEKLARDAVEINRRTLPASDPRLGRSLTALGSVLEHRGRYRQSIEVLEEAVRLQSGPDAEIRDLIESLTYLSNSERLLGDTAAAEPVAKRVLNLDRAVYGDRHPAIAEDLSNVAEILFDLGKFDEAERYDRQGLAILEAWYGKGRAPAETALISEALGKALVKERKYDEAEIILKRALDTQERTMGKKHPFVALALNWLGAIALKKGNLDDAESDFRRMMDIYQAVYGPRDGHVATALSRFGELAVARKQYPQAETFFRESEQQFSDTQSADNAKTGAVRIELGEVLLSEGRYKEAEQELLAGYQIVTRKSSFLPEAAANARKDLYTLNAAWHGTSIR